jgi:GPH family glycoside/pentoside/hexuronide:cation symporter
MAQAPTRLPLWSAYAAMLACAGLPIYIHAPKFYVDTYGVSLAAMGLALGLLRLVDVVQDPVLGWLAERWRARRGAMAAAGGAAMAAAMLALFAVPPPVAPALWFALTLLVLFSAYSLLTICFYAEGVAKAERLGPRGHLRLATWREAGALAGVSAAAVAPALLAGLERPFAAFALGFAGLALLVTLGMRGEWWGTRGGSAAPSWGAVLGDPMARRLLLLALVNGAPVAVTSTLFLYFVESRLAAPALAGPFLLAFFLSAAASAPLWGRVAARSGPRRALIAGMGLSIATFAFATTLGPGDTLAFLMICLASGAALGADMVLLPAIFARHLSGRWGGEAIGFGLWNFAAKLTLAAAAVTLLPALQAAGFVSGGANAEAPLRLLSLLYAALPCALKLAALALLLRTPVPED